MDDAGTALARLEAASREVEESAREVGAHAGGFGTETGARNRLALVAQRLKIALDELAAVDAPDDGVTDE